MDSVRSARRMLQRAPRRHECDLRVDERDPAARRLRGRLQLHVEHRIAMERPLVKAPLCCGAGFRVLLAEELETADEAGRFDDESLCYSRVAPVARCLAA